MLSSEDHSLVRAAAPFTRSPFGDRSGAVFGAGTARGRRPQERERALGSIASKCQSVYESSWLVWRVIGEVKQYSLFPDKRARGTGYPTFTVA